MPLTKVKPAEYSQQLQKKILNFKKLFEGIKTPALEVFSSPAQNFRMRAEFRIWHTEDRCFYAMFKPEDRKTPIEITDFPIACQSIQQLMPQLLEQAHLHPELKRKLFQVEFLASSTGDMLVTMIYHRALEQTWIELGKNLEKKLGCRIIGRSKKQRIVLSEDFVKEQCQVNGETFYYQQLENSFTQPNHAVNEKMLSWAQQQSSNFSGDLLELYCGNGNFTFPLSRNFNKVLATEMAKSGINSALHNQKLNQCENLELIRLQALEVSQALNKQREFRRLKHLNIDDYNFSCVFVDPPRAGIDTETLKFLSSFENILYISCNPETLRENINHLPDHQITSMAVFDQFPYTHHLEAGVLLKKQLQESL